MNYKTVVVLLAIVISGVIFIQCFEKIEDRNLVSVKQTQGATMAGNLDSLMDHSVMMNSGTEGTIVGWYLDKQRAPDIQQDDPYTLTSYEKEVMLVVVVNGNFPRKLTKGKRVKELKGKLTTVPMSACKLLPLPYEDEDDDE